MLKGYLNGSSLFDLSVIAMAIFLAMFVAVLVRVFQRARRDEYQHMATLPLDDDDGERSSL